jgi:endonuclease/exonuclease/phosphatase family metal-dependent hydrolase
VASGSANGEILVVSYNVHRCIGTDGEERPERVAAVLREIGADVVGVQEVDCEVHDQRFTDQLAYLAEESGMHWFAAPALRERYGCFGNGLLSRHPVERVEQIDLSVAGCEDRSSIEVDLHTPAGPLTVVNPHLGVERPHRRRQARKLLERLAAEAPSTLVVMGDFNEWFPGGGRTIRRLERVLGPSPTPRTYPSRCPLFALDRIWVRPRVRLRRVFSVRTPLARRASDHLPLVAALDLSR